jgi:hypothetical protein
MNSRLDKCLLDEIKDYMLRRAKTARHLAVFNLIKWDRVKYLVHQRGKDSMPPIYGVMLNDDGGYEVIDNTYIGNHLPEFAVYECLEEAIAETNRRAGY